MAAAKAVAPPTAPRMTYGLVLCSQILFITGVLCRMEYGAGITISVLVLIPCAVSRVWCIFSQRSRGYTEGLQLCDWGESSKYGAARCGDYSGGCQGAIFSNCHPNHVWSSSQVGIYYQIYQLNGGSFGYGENTCGNTGKYGKCALTYPFSVRCVLDLSINEGLQLCEGLESSKYGAAQCYPRYDGGCQGAANTNCYPDTVWSSMPSGSNGYIRAYLSGGNWRVPADEPYLYTYAFSVRCLLLAVYGHRVVCCVMDLIIKDFFAS